MLKGIINILVLQEKSSSILTDTESIQPDWEMPFSALPDEGRSDSQLEMLPDKLDIEKALGRINPREEAVIRLRFFLGLKQSAIARLMGISDQRVYQLQRRALHNLRSQLLGN